MQPIYTTDPQPQSADLMQTNIAQLRQLFPELITEGADGVAVNVDVLKALVGDRTVSDADETYGLNWHGTRHRFHGTTQVTSARTCLHPANRRCCTTGRCVWAVV